MESIKPILVKVKNLIESGHTYRIQAVQKVSLATSDPARRHIKGRWLFAVERDKAALNYCYSKTGLYNAYPNLKGHLDGWP